MRTAAEPVAQPSLLEDNALITGPFHVPKRTQTIGDTLIAWGLARLLCDLVQERDAEEIALVNEGVTYRITLAQGVEIPPDATPTAGTSSNLLYLASVKKPAPPDAAPYNVKDWEALRQAAQLARAQRGQGGQSSEDAASTAESALTYPFFAYITQPGKQWDGYNNLAQDGWRLSTPKGVRLVLRQYTTTPLSDTERVAGLVALGIAKSKQRRNPHGFLFPGQNKAPTMRLVDGEATVGGSATGADWLIKDWGHLSVIELYLAYVGFFAACRPLRGDEMRVVAVPEPNEVTNVLRWFDDLRPITGYAVESVAYMQAWAGLRYAEAVRTYLDAPDLVTEDYTPERVIRGVHLVRQWSPSGNTFATDRIGFAPLPAWLAGRMRAGGYEGAGETLKRHANATRNVWGGTNDHTGAVRSALDAYARSLAGDVGMWFEAVAGWFPVLRERDGRVRLWSWQEITEVATAMSNDVMETINDPAFVAVADAIRQATVVAHFAREGRRGSSIKGFDPQYDLLGGLLEAARRSKNDFLSQLFEFAATYNDETMRGNKDANHARRPMLRQEDLETVRVRVLTDPRGVVMRALLAYGSSPRRREAEVEDVPQTPPDDGETITAATNDATDDDNSGEA